mmetsp:Transcript_26614/g.51887  ORF Transcript_26614/g.51887 Transcript_26614/m.51887 type:complete len:220 (+) Transcript_26614:770-1429(+)
MRPPKLRELVLVRALLEQQNEGAEANGPSRKALERVMRSDPPDNGDLEVHHLDVLHEDLAIDEVDADEEEEPVQQPEHRDPLVLLSVALEPQNLLEHANLDAHDEKHDVHVPAGDDGQKAEKHGKGEPGAGPELASFPPCFLLRSLLLRRWLVGVREPLAARLEILEVQLGRHLGYPHSRLAPPRPRRIVISEISHVCLVLRLRLCLHLRLCRRSPRVG